MITLGKFTFSGVRARVLLLVALAVAPWLAITIYHAVEERRLAVDAAQENALRLARLISFDQRETITHSHTLLQALSTLPEINEGTPADCRLLLAHMLDSTQSYANIGIADAQGKLLCDAIATRKSINYSDRSWFRDALKTRRFVIGGLTISRTTGKPVIVTALPIFDAQGAVHRVVFTSIDIGWLEHLLQQVKLPTGTAVSVMDANGVILARHPAGQEYMGKLNPMAALVQAILARKEDGIGKGKGKGIDGATRLFAYHRLFENPATTSAYVSVTTPADILFAQSNRLFARDMAIVGLATALIFILVWFGDRKSVV